MGRDLYFTSWCSPRRDLFKPDLFGFVDAVGQEDGGQTFKTIIAAEMGYADMMKKREGGVIMKSWHPYLMG